MLASARVHARFWYTPKKSSGCVSKCDLGDNRHGVNQGTATWVRVVCISLINFAWLAATGRHLNFLGVRVGSGGPTVPHTLLAKLRAIGAEI